MSSAYRSLHINTSRERMEYSDFPMPKSYPDFPHHTHIAEYFDDYVDHFGFRDRITFETGVEHAARRPDGVWDGRARRRARRARYDALLVANGHHWDPRWPEPAFPGATLRRACRCTRTTTSTTRRLRAARTSSSLGMGNRAMDIAVEVALRRRADATSPPAAAPASSPSTCSASPLDQLAGQPARSPLRAPPALRPRAGQASCVGNMERYGLPEPDHRFGEAHPTISDDILTRIAHGEITPKPNIAALRATRCASPTAASSEADVVVYCTGYKVTFPFFDEDFISAPDNDLPLFRRVFHPDVDNLFFIALLQPLGAIMPLAEAQAHWVARLPARRVPPAGAGRRARRHGARARARCSSATWPPSATRCRSTSTTTCSSCGASCGEAASGRAGPGFALPVPARAGASVDGGGGVTRRGRPGKREQTKAANRAAILAAAGDAFAELGYGAATVRDIVRRTDLASGTFYNYFPDKEAVFRALVEERVVPLRAAVREARWDGDSLRSLRAQRLPGVLRVHRVRSGAARAAATQRGRHPRADRHAGAGRGRGRAARGRAGSDRARRPAAAWTPSTSPAAMAGVAYELATLMVERRPPDVEGAATFATDLFLGGIARMAGGW